MTLISTQISPSYTPNSVSILRSTAALRAPIERADKRVLIAHACAWQNLAIKHTALRAGCLSAR